MADLIKDEGNITSQGKPQAAVCRYQSRTTETQLSQISLTGNYQSTNMYFKQKKTLHSKRSMFVQ